MPDCSSCRTFSGLFESRRIFVAPKFFQDLRRKIVVSRIRGESQRFIGFDRVHAAVLQLIRTQLVHQSDAAALLRQIEQDSRPRLPDFLEREFELRTAIAAQRREHVAGQALRVHAHEGRGLSVDLPAHERDGFVQRTAALKSINREAAVPRRKRRLRDKFDLLVLLF